MKNENPLCDFIPRLRIGRTQPWPWQGCGGRRRKRNSSFRAERQLCRCTSRIFRALPGSYKPLRQESCSTKGALVFPQSIVTAGHVTNGKNGSCETGTETVSDFPVDLSPPFVTAFQTVGKSLDYDRNTGTGDASFTTYVGGKCNGQNSTALARRSSVPATRILWLPTMESG